MNQDRDKVSDSQNKEVEATKHGGQKLRGSRDKTGEKGEARDLRDSEQREVSDQEKQDHT